MLHCVINFLVKHKHSLVVLVRFPKYSFVKWYLAIIYLFHHWEHSGLFEHGMNILCSCRLLFYGLFIWVPVTECLSLYWGSPNDCWCPEMHWGVFKHWDIFFENGYSFHKGGSLLYDFLKVLFVCFKVSDLNFL